MKDEMTGNAPRCSFKRCALFALIFLLLTAASRALDIFAAAWEADVMADPASARAALVASLVISLIALAFSGGATVFAAVYGNGRVPFAAASLFTAAVFADRTFYVLYSVATRVKTFTADAGGEAYFRLAVDALFTAAAYYLAAYFAKRRKSVPGRAATAGATAFCASVTAGQLAHQTYVTVRFFSRYDDVTAVEKSSIAADYFFILLKYGVILFGAAILFFALLRAVCGRIDRKK